MSDGVMVRIHHALTNWRLVTAFTIPVASAHPWLASDRAGPSHRQNHGRWRRRRRCAPGA